MDWYIKMNSATDSERARRDPEEQLIGSKYRCAKTRSKQAFPTHRHGRTNRSEKSHAALGQQGSIRFNGYATRGRV